jgi:conjugal transfer pilus assembly protein TraK
MVEMSSLDINRVYCDGEMTDVIFSEEKGVKVKIVKNNAFVKFAVKKIEDREIPVENPVDLFFVCNDQVYNVIALPKRIPSAFIYLESKDKKKIQEAVERAKDLPYEKRLLDIIKAIYVNKYEPNYQVVRVNKEFYLFKDIKVVLEKVIDIEGEGLRAKVFSLTTQFDSNTQYVEIKEKDFVRKELTTIPLAISLDKTRLQGKDKATLIILEKRIVGE